MQIKTGLSKHCEQGSKPARGDPIGFRVQRLKLSAITASPVTYRPLASPLSRSVHFTSKVTRLLLLKSLLETFVMEDQFWALESKDMSKHYPYQVPNDMLQIKSGLSKRCSQGSNLHWATPMDFESNDLTILQSQLSEVPHTRTKVSKFNCLVDIYFKQSLKKSNFLSSSIVGRAHKVRTI